MVSEMNESDEIEKKSYKPEIVSFLMLIFACFGPTGIATSKYPEGGSTTFLLGMTWMIAIGSSVPSNGGGAPMPSPLSLLHPVSLFRLLFVYFLYRFYQDRTTRLSILVSGFIAELVLLLMNLSSIFSITQLYIPLTILLPIGLILVFTFPPDRIPGPWSDVSESDDWFREL